MDGAGDVFITDGSATQVTEVPAGGGAQFSLGSGLSEPDQVFVDAAGVLFIADVGNNRVVELNRSQAPTLSFAATAVGSTSTDSPMSTQIQNIGNEPLAAISPGIAVGTNFTQVTGNGPFTDCNSGFSLTAGALCNLSIAFTPRQVGSIQSSAVWTDNSLNDTAPAAQQTIALSGTGNPEPDTLTFITPTRASLMSTDRVSRLSSRPATRTQVSPTLRLLP